MAKVSLIFLSVLLVLLEGCAAKTIYLPHESGVYFKAWTECEQDRLSCEEDCDALAPFIEE